MTTIRGLAEIEQSQQLTVNGTILARRLIADLRPTHSPEPFLDRCLVIVAPPRSGTTFLQSLFHALPHVRTLPGWRCVGDVNSTMSERISLRRLERSHLDRLVPSLMRHHPISITGPEELNQLGARHALSLTHLTLFGIEPFALELDSDDAYSGFSVSSALNREFPRSSRPDTGYWVFKCPELFHRTSDARRIFPNGVLLNIGRERKNAFASWRRLVQAVHAETWQVARPFEQQWERFFEPSGDVDITVDFDDLCAAPLETVRQLDEQMTDDVDSDYSAIEELADLVRAVRPSRTSSIGDTNVDSVAGGPLRDTRDHTC